MVKADYPGAGYPRRPGRVASSLEVFYLTARTLCAHIPLLVQVLGQVSNVNASGALLARCKPGGGKFDLAPQNFALEHVWG